MWFVLCTPFPGLRDPQDFDYSIQRYVHRDDCSLGRPGVGALRREGVLCVRVQTERDYLYHMDMLLARGEGD